MFQIFSHNDNCKSEPEHLRIMWVERFKLCNVCNVHKWCNSALSTAELLYHQTQRQRKGERVEMQLFISQRREMIIYIVGCLRKKKLAYTIETVKKKK